MLAGAGAGAVLYCVNLCQTYTPLLDASSNMKHTRCACKRLVRHTFTSHACACMFTSHACACWLLGGKRSAATRAHPHVNSSMSTNLPPQVLDVSHNKLPELPQWACMRMPNLQVRAHARTHAFKPPRSNRRTALCQSRYAA